MKKPDLSRDARRPGAIYYVFVLLLLMGCAASAQAQYDSFEIVEYRLEQFSTSDEASIALYDSRGNQYGLLIFLHETQASNLPPAAKGGNGIIRLYFIRERWDDVLDQLRNEAPVVLNYWTGPGNNSHIATGWEPVGEGE